MEIPKHIAIIMDGNGRWATEKNLPRIEGHKEGIKTVKKIIQAAIENNIQYLTLYAFSSENWNRPKDEVIGLMELLNSFLKLEEKVLLKNKVRLKTIGRIHELPKNTYRAIEELKSKTDQFDRLTLTVALNYSSQNEIVDAVKAMIDQSQKGTLDIKNISYKKIAQNLDTKDLPDPDLIIRTSGEYRLSNFLLLQSAYAEIFISKIYWPDFDQSNFEKAISHYTKRERRFGTVVNKDILETLEHSS